jgi:hypothetical protein
MQIFETSFRVVYYLLYIKKSRAFHSHGAFRYSTLFSQYTATVYVNSINWFVSVMDTPYAQYWDVTPCSLTMFTDVLEEWKPSK